MRVRRSGPLEERVSNQFRLAVARDLQRLYSDALTEPVPQDLRTLVERLDDASGHALASEPKRNSWWRVLRRANRTKS
jgi:hypothetical protein